MCVAKRKLNEMRAAREEKGKARKRRAEAVKVKVKVVDEEGA